MATTSQHLLLSPAELAYLHSSLSLTPPLRPDGRTATQFRPLTAETGILPGTNGSARVCFADGTEAVVGVKAEVERTVGTKSRVGEGDSSSSSQRRRRLGKGKCRGSTTTTTTTTTTEPVEERIKDDDEDEGMEGEGEGEEEVEYSDAPGRRGENDWVELSVEIPGYRDDDSGTVFLATMLSEALLADGELTKKLWINRRFHWKLYLDIILISPPLSYPLPLLSVTTHLALLAARLPRLKSEGDEDPMFDDDWAASQFIYPRAGSSPAATTGTARPPITLLVMAVADNVIFDPSKEELAVADCALAVSVGESGAGEGTDGTVTTSVAMDIDGGDNATGARATGARVLRLLSVRTIDPPSRLTAPGVPNAVNAAAWGHGAPPSAAATASTTGAGKETTTTTGLQVAETGDVEGVWKAPRGGSKITIISTMVEKVLRSGGVADEVLDGLEGVELA